MACRHGDNIICVEDPPEIFARHRMVDLSEFPLERVARYAEKIRLSGYYETIVLHDDLWHDGRWAE